MCVNAPVNRSPDHFVNFSDDEEMTSFLCSLAAEDSAPPLEVLSLPPLPPARKRRRRPPQPPGNTASHQPRRFVRHNYHDLSSSPDSPEGPPTTRRLSPGSFPLKLHHLLSTVDSANLSHIVSWQPHGRAFLIRDPKRFVSEILPVYFPKIQKLSSVQRQLNLYGFERLSRDGPDRGAYYHEAFLRGREEMTACRVERVKVKGTGYKAAGNPGEEPEFYSMPCVGAERRVTKEDEGELGGFPEVGFGANLDDFSGYWKGSGV